MKGYQAICLHAGLQSHEPHSAPHQREPKALIGWESAPGQERLEVASLCQIKFSSPNAPRILLWAGGTSTQRSSIEVCIGVCEPPEW